jgi:aryl-alcohol dehydrogenase-like predicted oxidoreductase
MEREESGQPFPEMVKVAEGLWHCMHPAWLKEQLDRSLMRLGLETLDVCLLHNPEYFLGEAAKRRVPLAEARAEFARRITEAFRHLEGEVTAGRLRFYGVSSNSIAALASEPEATDLEAFLAAAREAGGDRHHFRVVQLPLNLLESAAALPAEGTAVVERASAAGLAVLVNRPLNAIMEGRVVRLADPPSLPEGPSFSEQQAVVRDLEAEYARTIAPSVEVPKDSGARPAEFFRWADQLGNIAMELDSLEHWRDIETQAVAPRIMQVVDALDQILVGQAAVRWKAFRDRYLSAIDVMFGALRRRAADRSRRRSLAIARAVDPLLPEDRRGAPLSQKALSVVASVSGVTTVLVGMREADYVADAVAMMGAPRIERVAAILTACRSIDL